MLQAGPPNESIKWKIDFSFVKNGELWYAEAKGFPTPEYELKLKIFRHKKLGKLEIWKGNHIHPTLVEVIE